MEFLFYSGQVNSSQRDGLGLGVNCTPYPLISHTNLLQHPLLGKRHTRNDTVVNPRKKSNRTPGPPAHVSLCISFTAPGAARAGLEG